MKRSIVLFSGGLDSTVLAHLESQTHGVTALSVSYGQSHAAELAAATKICRALHLEQRVVRVRLDALAAHPLLGWGELPTRTLEEIRSGLISPAFLPGRNLVFLALGIGLADQLGAERVCIAANRGDALGFPDCRIDFIRAVAAVARLAVQTSPLVVAPFADRSKSGIVTLGAQLGSPLGDTLSCYQPLTPGPPGISPPIHCGRCDACVLRLEAFEEAGIEDPAIYPGCL